MQNDAAFGVPPCCVKRSGQMVRYHEISHLRGKMTEKPIPGRSEHVYRVDKFVVPPHARDEFLSKVRKTHELLRTLPGFLRDLVLEQSSGPGEFNFVTVAEWDDPASVENAKAAVKAMHEAMNFNPQELFARLGIKADVANYQQVRA
jgi:heme-degrading monooxygenase HmoA